MTMPWVHFSSWLLLLLVLTLAQPAPSHAHELKNNTARVELRDNHFRILVDVKVLDWLAALKETAADSTRTFESGEIPELLERAKETLLAETTLVSDGTLADIRLLYLPSEKDILGMLEHFAWLQENRRSLPHGFGWSTLQLEGILDGQVPKQVEVSFPASLGEMPISFSEPKSQWVQPAQRAAFSATPKPPKPNQPQIGSAALGGKWAGIGVLFALFLVLYLSSKNTKPRGAPDKTS